MTKSQDSSDHRDGAIGQPGRPGQNLVAVDGPAGSGKTTVAVRLAERLGAVFLDTGVLYRAATLMAIRDGSGIGDASAIADRLRHNAIVIRPPSVADGRYCDVLLDGEDVTSLLRTRTIDQNVSAISALPDVRNALLPIQRAFAAGQRTIMVGRDIASVIFPDAAVKIYLNASPAERARRRWRELAGKGSPLSYEEVLADMIRRDAIDSQRETAPLQIDDKAILVETDNATIDDVVDRVTEIALRTLNRA